MEVDPLEWAQREFSDCQLGEPDKAASEVVPRDWVNLLAKARRLPSKGPSTDMTLAQFVKHLAGLGGHLGRKSDGRPGW